MQDKGCKNNFILINSNNPTEVLNVGIVLSTRVFCMLAISTFFNLCCVRIWNNNIEHLFNIEVMSKIGTNSSVIISSPSYIIKGSFS